MSKALRVTIMPLKKRVSLNDCPVGLFLFENTLAVMTEYWTYNGGRQRDAYIVDSGEYFWGGTKDAEQRAKLKVTPCKVNFEK